ncbi:hypothetical protein BDZ88DRAFT_57819 [Geranomyces variabilis]|nr:hypothetical protein BDZ88DRAFT_57819 [Geranomyces variabilis]
MLQLSICALLNVWLRSKRPVAVIVYVSSLSRFSLLLWLLAASRYSLALFSPITARETFFHPHHNTAALTIPPTNPGPPPPLSPPCAPPPPIAEKAPTPACWPNLTSPLTSPASVLPLAPPPTDAPTQNSNHGTDTDAISARMGGGMASHRESQMCGRRYHRPC